MKTAFPLCLLILSHFFLSNSSRSLRTRTRSWLCFTPCHNNNVSCQCRVWHWNPSFLVCLSFLDKHQRILSKFSDCKNWDETMCLVFGICEMWKLILMFKSMSRSRKLKNANLVVMGTFQDLLWQEWRKRGRIYKCFQQNSDTRKTDAFPSYWIVNLLDWAFCRKEFNTWHIFLQFVSNSFLKIYEFIGELIIPFQNLRLTTLHQEFNCSWQKLPIRNSPLHFRLHHYHQHQQK